MYKLEPLPYIIQHTGELFMAILNYTNKARRFKSFMHSQIHVFFLWESNSSFCFDIIQGHSFFGRFFLSDSKFEPLPLMKKQKRKSKILQ